MLLHLEQGKVFVFSHTDIKKHLPLLELIFYRKKPSIL